MIQEPKVIIRNQSRMTSLVELSYEDIIQCGNYQQLYWINDAFWARKAELDFGVTQDYFFHPNEIDTMIVNPEVPQSSFERFRTSSDAEVPSWTFGRFRYLQLLSRYEVTFGTEMFWSIRECIVRAMRLASTDPKRSKALLAYFCECGNDVVNIEVGSRYVGRCLLHAALVTGNWDYFVRSLASLNAEEDQIGYYNHIWAPLINGSGGIDSLRIARYLVRRGPTLGEWITSEIQRVLIQNRRFDILNGMGWNSDDMENETDVLNAIQTNDRELLDRILSQALASGDRYTYELITGAGYRQMQFNLRDGLFPDTDILLDYLKHDTPTFFFETEDNKALVLYWKSHHYGGFEDVRRDIRYNMIDDMINLI